MLEKAKNWCVIIEYEGGETRVIFCANKQEALKAYDHEMMTWNDHRLCRIRIFKYAGRIQFKQMTIQDLIEIDDPDEQKVLPY